MLCAVLDAAALGPAPRDTAALLFGAGVDWIQLRDRAVEADELFRITQELVAARDAVRAASTTDGRASAPGSGGAGTDGPTRRVIVNRRVDVALAAGADGVHLGFDALDVASAAALLPAEAWIGVSAHAAAEIEAMGDAGPRRYAHLAPVWEPLSKPAERPALGVEQLTRACGLGVPILAQGGVDPARASEAVAAGAAGVAVTGILGRPSDRLAVARRLRDALDAGLAPRG